MPQHDGTGQGEARGRLEAQGKGELVAREEERKVHPDDAAVLQRIKDPVERMDVLYVLHVSPVSIFQDAQSKLVLVTCIGAILWSLHGTYKLCVARQNSLIDRLEDMELNLG